MLRLAFGLWLLSSLPALAGYGPTVTPEEMRREFTYARALVTGTVEGVTEYLPVSSTGHMILSDSLLGVPKFADVTVSGVTDRKDRAVSMERVADEYIVIIQLGAILAVLVAFFGRLSGLLVGVVRGDRASLQPAFALVVAFLPAALLGFLFKDTIAATLFSVEVVAVALVVGGIAILVAEKLLPSRPAQGDEVAALGWRSALTVGLCQCCALIPGTSRSLATILGGRLVGLSHAASTEFSFLVGLLTLSAASLYKMWSLGPALTQVYPAGPAGLGLLIAAVTAFVSVKWLVAYVSRRGLGVFAWYRIALGGAILTTLALR
ncbi:MAG: undecaprenyl-diphosphate phosphatase [Verrucomicrobiota bacterium]